MCTTFVRKKTLISRDIIYVIHIWISLLRQKYLQFPYHLVLYIILKIRFHKFQWKNSKFVPLPFLVLELCITQKKNVEQSHFDDTDLT